MYDLPKLTIASDMKNDITLTSTIKIKLISNDFFNIQNISLIGAFLNPNQLHISSIEMGIDRVIKFKAYIPITEILQNYTIPLIMRNWINSDTNRITLSSILTEEEFNSLYLHFEMFYQIETFLATNTIFIRI